MGQGTAPDWDQAMRLMTEAGDDAALARVTQPRPTRATERAERRKLDDRAHEAAQRTRS